MDKNYGVRISKTIPERFEREVEYAERQLVDALYRHLKDGEFYSVRIIKDDSNPENLSIYLRIGKIQVNHAKFKTYKKFGIWKRITGAIYLLRSGYSPFVEIE